MKLMKVATLLVSIAIPSALIAQSAEDALEARHGYMKLLGNEMGKLSAMAKGEVAYDEAAATAAAKNLATLTSYSPVSLFIDGTSSEDDDDSEALPAVWEKPDDFAAKFDDLSKVAADAPAAVAGGVENLGAEMAKLGGACKACHDDFRKKQ